MRMNSENTLDWLNNCKCFMWDPARKNVALIFRMGYRSRGEQVHACFDKTGFFGLLASEPDLLFANKLPSQLKLLYLKAVILL